MRNGFSELMGTLHTFLLSIGNPRALAGTRAQGQPFQHINRKVGSAMPAVKESGHHCSPTAVPRPW